MARRGTTFTIGPDDDPDKYRLIRQVGDGGEAALWKAEFDLSGQPETVAVKVLLERHSSDFDAWRRRWAAQVELLRLVRHPAIVGVHCHFEGLRLHPAGDLTGDGRALYLVMNWVDGLDLREWIMRHSDLADWVERIRLLTQIASVLDWLHSGEATGSRRPVVHGDISPGNVMIDDNGQAVLVDFGLFRMVRHVTAVRAGTPGFCAPEIAEGGEYSPASDRYAFGALALYVLTGSPPPTTVDALQQTLEAIAGAASTPESTRALARIFAVDPAERPGTLEWLNLLRTQTSTTTVTGGTLRPSRPPSPTSTEARDRALRDRTRTKRPPALTPGQSWSYGRWLAYAAAIATVLSVIVVAVLVKTNGNVDAQDARTPTYSSAASTRGPVGATATRPQAATTPTTTSAPARVVFPGEPAGLIYNAGNLKLDPRYEGLSDADLDSNDKYPADDEIDLRARPGRLGTQNAALLSVWSTVKPSLADCLSIVEQNWTSFVEEAQYMSAKSFCIRSNDGRFGYLQPRLNQEGRVTYLEPAFILWKKPGDR